MKKNTLIKDYFDNLLSFKQIAEKYNISTRKVWEVFHRYKLTPRKKWKEPNKGRILTNYQESFIYAKLLGDGCITKSKHHATYHFEFAHEEKQRKYAVSCFTILKDWGTYCEKVRIRDPKVYKKHKWIECTFKSINHQEFSRIYRHTYENNKKIINKEILEMIDEFGLAIWYMDDGHKATNQNAGYLNTLCFTLEENKMIVEWLYTRFGIKANVVAAGKSRNGKNILYRIRLCSKTWSKFVDIVQPFISSDLMYKIGKNIVQSS